MKTLRIDAWCYRAGMAFSAVAVAAAIPIGLFACIMAALDLL
jgi:hypothetical protein